MGGQEGRALGLGLGLGEARESKDVSRGVLLGSKGDETN